MPRIVLETIYDLRDGKNRAVVFARGHIITFECVDCRLALPVRGTFTSPLLHEGGLLIDSNRTTIVPAGFCSREFPHDVGDLFLIAHFEKSEVRMVKAVPSHKSLEPFTIARSNLRFDGPRLGANFRDALIFRKEGDAYVEAV